MRYTVGIDWADEKFDVCLLNDTGATVKALVITKDVEGFLQLLDELRKLGASGQDVRCLIETPHSPLVDFLLHHGYAVYHINPKTVAACRERYTVSQAKSDHFDAFVLADVMRTDQRAPRPLTLGTEQSREIAVLTADLRSLIDQKVALDNALLATVKTYYPVFVELFEHPTCKTACAFLEAYPTYDVAHALSESALQTFFRGQRYYQTVHIQHIAETLAQPQIPIDTVIVRAKSRKALALLAQLRPLLGVIRDYEQAIWALVECHPDTDIFRSLPGAGTRLVPVLLGLFGDNRDRFQTYQEVQQYAGSAPVTISSGKYHTVRFRRACHKRFRNALQQFAFTSLKECLWAKTYYHQLIQRGKTHQHALRCVANKWVKILFTMWKTHTLYDEQKHLAQIATQQMIAQT